MPLPKMAVAKLLDDETALCLSDVNRLINALVFIIKVHFGINPDILPKDDPEPGMKEGKNLVIMECLRIIKEKYPTLTFGKLNLSFTESVIDKKQGVSLTAHEIIRYIEDMSKKIKFINYQVDQEIIQAKQENEYNDERKRFQREAIDLYLECVKSDGIWTGTVYQSTAIAKDCLSQSYSDESKKLHLFPLANQLAKDLNSKEEKPRKSAFEKVVDYGYTKEQIFSHAMVIHACEQRKPILVD